MKLHSPIVFWLHFPSFHHCSLVQQVARQHRGKTYVVFAQPLPRERSALGWPTVDFTDIEAFFEPSKQQIRTIINDLGKDCIHLFFGFHAYPKVYFALKYTANLNYQFYVWMEPVDFSGLIGLPKRVLYFVHWQRFKSCLAGVFITGQKGVKSLVRCGFYRKRLSFFFYPTIIKPDYSDSDVTPISLSPPQDNNFSASHFKIIFVGQLIKRKAIDLLMAALARLNHHDFQLTLVGSGHELNHLRYLSERFGFNENVIFLGPMQNEQVVGLISSQDMLVLPSRFDGWGFVANESISVGTPVIVSDECGCSDVVIDAPFCRIFKSNSLASLASSLQGAIAQGPLTRDQRYSLIGYATNFSASNAAKVLISKLLSSV